MRLRDLHLIRFGHFSDLSLDFAADGKTFHVIYGHNEAGKSTALRAISGLLFGIPERTRDAHQHAARDLRIRAELENRAGERLNIVRRKGRKDTLLDEHESPIAESRLGPYLGGVSRELFEAMFGMNHERLVMGGRELLAGHGEVGEALFGAAAGLRGLHQLVESLQSEAAEIFKLSGQLPRLNKALAQHREARVRIKHLTLKPSDWEKTRRRRDGAREAFVAAREDLARSMSRLEDRRALQNALPDLRTRAAQLARRRELGEVVMLAEDSQAQRRDAQSAFASANQRIAKLEDQKARLETNLAGLEVPDRLLALEARANDLNDSRAVFIKASRDRQGLLSKLDSCESELRALLRELPKPRSLEDAEGARIDAATQTRIRELARQGQLHQSTLETLREKAKEATRRFEDAEAVFGEFPAERDATPLIIAIEAARREGDLEARLRQLEAALANESAQAQQRLRSLPLWNGSLQGLVESSVPSDETVEAFEQQFAQVAEERRAQADRRRKIETDLDELSRKLAALERAGEIPGPEDLNVERRRRDDVWTRVRRLWLEGLDEARPPAQLADEYEERVAQTDSLGDRMFEEHERVARIETLRDLKRQAEQDATDASREGELLDGGEADLTRDWIASWAASEIRPSTPREMRAWKSMHRELLVQFREIGRLETEAGMLGRQIETHRHACLTALAEFENPERVSRGSLATIVETAKSVVQGIETARQERVRLTEAAASASREKQRCERDRRAVEEEIESWRQQWRESVARIDLSEDARPGEAEAVLDKLDQVFSKLDQRNLHRDRIRHIEQDNLRFESELQALIAEGCPEVPDGPPEQRSAELLARLQRGREDRSKRESWREGLSEIENELRESRRDSEVSTAILETLMKNAGVSSVDELDRAERNSAEMRELEEKLVEVEARLRASGRSIEELVHLAVGVHDEELVLEIGELEEAVEVNGQRRDEARDELRRLEEEFEKLDGGEAAAEAAREAEEALAQISYLAVEYARKRIAAVVLGGEIKRYAEENQGPILKRTSELFRRMTLDRYQAVVSGFSDEDEAILRCQRPNGDEVGVEGLSDGARDQLYLSLRLAALEHHMKQNEAMPLIVDDVLVTFDDPRSRATLRLMGETAVDGQVLFFTHHQRLVELAREAIPQDQLAVHELERP